MPPPAGESQSRLHEVKIERERRGRSSLGMLAEGSNWQGNTSDGPECVCLLKLELSAEKLWSVVSR